MSQSTTANSDISALQKIESAYRALYAIGILCLFIGGIASALALADDRTGIGIVAALMLIFGALYFLLGRMVKGKSTTALVIAMVIMVLNIITGIVNTVHSGSFVTLALPVGMLYVLYPAYGAIQELKEKA